MIAAVKIINEVEAVGTIVKMEGEKLKLIRGKLLSPSLLELVRANKPELIEVLTRDQKARQAGFIPLISGEVYERQYSPTSHVFVTMESNLWTAHRETWKPGKKESVSKKQIAELVSYDMALLKAQQYIEYVTGGKKR
jgi:hypothetical protein